MTGAGAQREVPKGFQISFSSSSLLKTFHRRKDYQHCEISSMQHAIVSE
jgi:hypothetical protein